eukprot:g45662.t1
MADQLNKYFGSVFTKEDTNNLLEMLGDRGTNMKEELKEILTSQEMVLGKLMGLKLNKSPGPDALHSRVLKEVALEISDALAIIFQHSIDFGKVPMAWRQNGINMDRELVGRQEEKSWNKRVLFRVAGSDEWSPTAFIATTPA